MTEAASKRRRWPRFTLRTLFVTVMIAGLACWWASRQLNWIAERRLFLRTAQVHMTFGDVPAPWQIRLFGAQGYGGMTFTDDPNQWVEMQFHSLFPESTLIKHVSDGVWDPDPRPADPP